MTRFKFIKLHQADVATGRLARQGFTHEEAERLSAMHTRNFM
jgi:hypothetical protein